MSYLLFKGSIIIKNTSNNCLALFTHMEHKFDINDFYMIEYICSKCSNICSKNDDICSICGDKNIIRKAVSRSCLRYSYCSDLCCGFASHEKIAVCPKCGRGTIGHIAMIQEDHYGYPIPSECDCTGYLRDEDEGKQAVMSYFELMKYLSKKEEQKQTENQSPRSILKRLLGLFKN